MESAREDEEISLDSSIDKNHIIVNYDTKDDGMDYTEQDALLDEDLNDHNPNIILDTNDRIDLHVDTSVDRGSSINSDRSTPHYRRFSSSSIVLGPAATGKKFSERKGTIKASPLSTETPRSRGKLKMSLKAGLVLLSCVAFILIGFYSLSWNKVQSKNPNSREEVVKSSDISNGSILPTQKNNATESPIQNDARTESDIEVIKNDANVHNEESLKIEDAENKNTLTQDEIKMLHEIISNLEDASQVIENQMKEIYDSHHPYGEYLFNSVHWLNNTILHNKITKKVLLGNLLPSPPFDQDHDNERKASDITEEENRADNISAEQDVSQVPENGNENSSNIPSSIEDSTEKATKKTFSESFIIGVQGTSVTAGHDNYFYQSYPIVWSKLMKNSFNAAGLNLEMRNHARGWNPVYPEHLCSATVVGTDIDLAVWEFMMMSHGDQHDWEVWMRQAYMLDKQPALLILDPGNGMRNHEDGKPEPKERKDKARVQLVSDIHRYYANRGFSIATNSLREALYNLDHLPQYQYGHLFPDGKVTRHPAGWHPGPFGHELRAQILAHDMLSILNSAVKQSISSLNLLIETRHSLQDYIAMMSREFNEAQEKEIENTDLRGKAISQENGNEIDDNSNKKEINIPLTKRLELPPPKLCHPDICNFRPAHCITSFLPHVGHENDILNYVTKPSHKDIIVLDSPKDRLKMRNNEVKTWHTQLYFCDVGAVFDNIDMGYLDRKIVLQGEPTSGSLEFTIETKSENHLILCSAPGNKHIFYYTDYTLTKVEEKENGQKQKKNMPFSLVDYDQASNLHLPKIHEPCYLSKEKVVAGNYILKVTPQKIMSEQKDPFLPFSHLIWF